MRRIASKLYVIIIYYFSFFYIFDIYNIGNSSLISGLKEILILICVLLLMMTRTDNSKLRFKRNYLGVSVAYFIVLLAAAVRSTTLSYAYIDLKYFLIWPLMIYITTKIIDNYSDYKRILFHVNIICIIIGIIGFLAYQKHILLFTQWRTIFQVNAPKSILSTSFDFGALMALAIFYNLVTIYFEKLKIWRLGFISFYAYMTYLSYTRGSYLSLIAFVYLILRSYFVKKAAVKKWHGTVKLVVDVFMVLLCIYIYFNFSDTNALSIDSLVDRVINVWPSLKVDSIFLGDGFGTVGRSVNGISLYGVSDNSFLRIILSMGLLGLAIILIIFKKIYDKANNKTLLRVLYASVGVTAFFSDYIVFTPAMILVYCAIGMWVKVKPGYRMS